MQIKLVRTIFLKELRDILRDRRTLFMMIVLPLLLYPIMLIGFAQITALQMAKIAQKKSRIVVIGREYGGHLTTMLDTLSNVSIEAPGEWRERIVNGELEAVIVISDGFWDSLKTSKTPAVSVFYTSAKEVSVKARTQLEDLLDHFRDGVIEMRLADLRADTSLLHPFSLHSENLATPQQRQGDLLGKFLGYMIIMMMVMGAFYPAVDLTAGEKERGTLETLLVSPVGRDDIVYGKFFTVVIISMITAALNLLSLGGTVVYMAMTFGKASKAFSMLAVSPGSLLMSLFLLIPLAVIFSALCLAVAVSARNYKEGQNLITPIYMAMIIPSAISFMPGAEITPLLSLVPVANVSLLIREYLMGHYPLLESTLCLASSWALAIGALHWAVFQFKQESVLFRHAEEIKFSLFRRKRGAAGPKELLPSSGTAIMVVMVLLILLFTMANEAQSVGVIASLLMSQAVILFIPLLVLIRGRYDLRKTFVLHLPRPAVWPATVVLMIGGWLIGVQLASLQNLISPFPEEFLKRFESFFAGLNDLPIPLALLLIGVLPGLCEELLCRGFLISAFRPKIGKSGAVVLAAVAFGILHLDPFRLASTTFLGLILGCIVIWTGSIYPAMLAHACNNIFSFLVQRNQDALSTMKWLDLESMNFLPWYIVLFGIVTVSAGLWWLKKIGSRSPAE